LPTLAEELLVDNNTSRGLILRVVVLLLIGAGLALAVYYAPAYFITEPKKPTYTHLKTGGTSSVAILMENRWKTAYRDDKSILVDYDSSGSTNGIAQMIDGSYTICFTHAPLSEDQVKQAREKGGEILHVPVVLCAVVPVYNVEELAEKPPLKFTGEVLASIYLGKITKWNDPAIQKLNEGVELPDKKIVPVHRADSSGSTLIFTDYLAGASPTWKKEVGPGKSQIKWPSGSVGMRRTGGVSDYVRQTDGAIGYVDLMNAWADELEYRGVQYGAVENKDHNAFIHVEAENMTAAARAMLADIPADLTFKLTNQPGKEAYPITGGIWAVCYQNQPAANQQQVTDFLRWVIHDGQKWAKNSAYAPLPDELVQRADDKLQTIKPAQ
jgi:phosphate transport system substrate-binding protein